MKIHDLVFAVGCVVLTLSLVPGLRDKIQVPLWTSLLSFVTVGVFALNYLTMGYYFTTAVCGLQAVLWGVVAGRHLWRRRSV